MNCVFITMNWQFLILVFLWNAEPSIAQDCLQGAETTQTQIPFEDLNDDPLPAGGTSQAIITTYQFQCCGEITEWQTYVRPDGGAHQNGALTMHFQVWRPTPTSGGDCYSLVGENRFTSVMFDSGDSVRESPQSSDRIEVRPGDVLGYFSTAGSHRPEQNQGIQLERSFTNDRVFFAALDGPLMMGPEACPVSVGPGGALSSSINAAPVFSVDISSSSCPPLPPPIMMTSSSTPVPQPSVTPTPPPQTTPPGPPTTPSMTEELTEAPATPPDGGREQPTTATIIIIAPINTQTITDTAAAVVDSARSTILPTVIGVVCTVIILTASLITLLVAIAITRRKTSRSNNLVTNQDLDIQGNNSYNSRFADKSYGVITDANPAYSCPGMELRQNQAYVATNIPVEPNQCYGTTTPSVDPDWLYATVEGEHNITHTSQQPTPEDYDYVIP